VHVRGWSPLDQSEAASDVAGHSIRNLLGCKQRKRSKDKKKLLGMAAPQKAPARGRRPLLQKAN
jgi:hypothetical protein